MPQWTSRTLPTMRLRNWMCLYVCEQTGYGLSCFMARKGRSEQETFCFLRSKSESSVQSTDCLLQRAQLHARHFTTAERLRAIRSRAPLTHARITCHPDAARKRPLQYKIPSNYVIWQAEASRSCYGSSMHDRNRYRHRRQEQHPFASTTMQRFTIERICPVWKIVLRLGPLSMVSLASGHLRQGLELLLHYCGHSDIYHRITRGDTVPILCAIRRNYEYLNRRIFADEIVIFLRQLFRTHTSFTQSRRLFTVKTQPRSRA